MPTVAVVGAGVAGLAAAHRLHRLGLSVVVYEAADRVGGVVESRRQDGYLAEFGPNAIAAPPPRLAEVLTELGLDGRRVVAAPTAAKRFVVRRGRLWPLPTSPKQVLTSRLLSNSAKLAIFGEPFVEPAESPVEESVAAFVRRRFNQEVLEYAVDPFVAGVCAGDPEQLSLRHAFPRIHAMETSHGSVLKAAAQAAKANRRNDGPMPALAGMPFAFRDGLQELPNAFARALGDAVRLGSAVSSIDRDASRWTVAAKFGEPATYDAVICAAPAYNVADIDGEIVGRERLAALQSIEYPPVAVLVLGFSRDEVAHPLDGFGFLVPKSEQRHVLGVLFSSSLFSERAPEGHVTLTAFVGGARDPQFADLDDHTLIARVLDDLRALLGVRGEPTFRAHRVWPRAIPQYVLGYGRFKELLDDLERRNPGLIFAGSYRDGVSVADAVLSGEHAAARVAVWLAERA